ncbi:MAG TPA: hypothetical protein VEI57_13565 [Nitrospirota bacterium]|nr:hypothetical protein [Nitrospirota bacterium]
MPIDIKLLHDGIGVLYDCNGTLTGQDLIDANKKILAFGEEIKHLRYGLIDESAINDLNISESEMTTIAMQDEKIASLVPDGAIVAVIAKSAFAFGLSRLWESFIEHTGWETMTFRDRLMAESWIRAKVKANFGIDLTFG